MKYVVVQNPSGFERVFLALAPVTHADLAAAFAHAPDRVVSAGFVQLAVEGIRTFGRSDSLNVGPRPRDARLIDAMYRSTLRVCADVLPETILVRVGENGRGGWSLFPVNEPARALMGDGETGNFATPTDARRRAACNCWEVVEPSASVTSLQPSCPLCSKSET